MEYQSVFFFRFSFFGCRWRDVKQCAFDNAKHRTYVDLKVSDTCDQIVHVLPEFSIFISGDAKSLIIRKNIAICMVIHDWCSS